MLNEVLPEESAKIAIRRERRLEAKIKEAKTRLKIAARWRGGEKLIALGGGLIFCLNIYLIWPFFGGEAYNTTYSGPVIPFLAKIIAWLTRLPLAYAIEIINIIFFLAFPVSLYLLVKKVSGKPLVAMLAGLVASLPISPFAGVRIQGMFFTVESPHIASLSMVPIAIYGLMAFLESGGLKSLVLASLGVTAVSLISPFGLMAYVIFSGIVTFSEILLGHGRLKLARVATVLLLTGGLSSFWYNPGFFWWLVTGPLGLEWREMITRLIPISLFIVPILGVFGYLLFDRKPELQPLFLGIFLTTAFLLIIVSGIGLMPSMPFRYLPELGVAVAFLTGAIIDRVLEMKLKINRLIINLILFLLVAGMTVGILVGRNKLLAYNTRALGLWTGLERGHIWRARENFEKGFSWLGQGITLTTLVFLGVVKKKAQE